MGESKFSGLSAAIREAQEQTDTKMERTEAPLPKVKTTSTNRGRQPGKRSNPNWKQHTVMLEKEIHLSALDLLRRQDKGQDISDLLNSLLADWVKRQKAKM